MEVTTLEDGVILTSRDTIPVEVALRSGNYQQGTLTLEVFNAEDRLIEEKQVTGTELADAPPLALPEDIVPGSYRLVLRTFQGEDLDSEQTLPFFVAGKRPRVSGITSFPVVLQPEAQALLSLDLSSSDENLWIRWSLEDKVIRRGLLSELSPQITIGTPKTEGIYTVKAEIFLFPPPAGEKWNFSSAIFEESLIYVSREMLPGSYNLDPPESFYILHHFQGEFSDWGSSGTPMALIPRSEPVLDETLGIFGYRLDQFGGFTGSRFPFPVTPEGRLEPFSLVMIMGLPEAPGEGELFLGENEAGDFRLSWTIGGGGIPQVEVVSGEKVYNLEVSESWDADAYSSLILSVAPDYEGGRLHLSFYQEGEMLARTSDSWEHTGFDQRGRYFIGGFEGAPIVLDELGVYYRDGRGRPSTLPDIFLEDRWKTYGTRLIYADGFDGSYLREEVVIQRLMEQEFEEERPYRLKAGSLGIAPETRCLFPPLSPDNKEVSGILSFDEEPGEGTAILFLGTLGGKEFVREFPLAGRKDIAFSLPTAKGRLNLAEGKAAFLMRQFTGTDSIRVGLANRGESDFFIEDVVILKGGSLFPTDKPDKKANPRAQRESTEKESKPKDSAQRGISDRPFLQDVDF